MAFETAEGDFFTGTASLVNQLDKRVLVLLRDGRHLVGILRSFDQFCSCVLEETTERHIVDGKVAEIPLGLFLLRGENMAMLCELDTEKDDHAMSSVLVPAPVEEVMAAERALRRERPEDDDTVVKW